MTDVAISAGRQTMAIAQRQEIPGKLFEWVASSMMIGIAATLTIWPKSLEAGSLRILSQQVGAMVGDALMEPVLAGCFLAGGLLRCFTLYANGHWPVTGPRLRGLGAAFGAVLWSQMSFAVVPLIGDLGHGALAVVVFGCMACGEIVSCYRSGAHGRWRW